MATEERRRGLAGIGPCASFQGCHGTGQVVAVPDHGGGSQQSGGCEDADGLPVDGLVVAAAGPVNVLRDRRSKRGVDEVLTEGPGPAQEGADQSQVSEGVGGFFRRALRAEERKQACLKVQCFRAGVWAVVLADLIQADGAGTAVPACLSGLERQAALDEDVVRWPRGSR